MAREPQIAALPAPARLRGEGAEGEGKARKGRESGSGTAFAGALVLLTLFGIGTGVGLGLTLGEIAPPAVIARADGAPASAASDADVSLVRMEPVVANLVDPADVWVRVDGALLTEGVAPEEADALAARVAGDTLAYLRTLPLARLEGATGLAHLREDLTERARTRSEGRVREFVIESLVVQ
ncbi:flagellar basal body-associated FliL family protein [Salinarimonas ramus]|uniref:Flagellar protein FliL n=1 Tax=Salinarimonas ramus TaxID=690164 RepID=A0A917QBC6_9HYPH|nr:flagellar basal body-associated FliL family protein [Salinarimonas ramus]GGK41726.1 hypothetical protein GCM10011322_31080 [Salinarimonas ramus]